MHSARISGEGLRVSVIEPGTVRTEFGQTVSGALRDRREPGYVDV